MPKSSRAILLGATGKFAQTYHVGLFDLATFLYRVSIGFRSCDLYAEVSYRQPVRHISIDPLDQVDSVSENIDRLVRRQRSLE
jgi:hypothetical protein